jgi:hypothetical protein
MVWECWISSLGMLGRREGRRERDKLKREEREKIRSGRERGIGERE